jgi:transposase InsO family protein
MAERIGELGHIDCHYLPKGMIIGEKRRYLVGVVDDASRIMWVVMVPDLSSMRVSFGAMRCIFTLGDRYGIRFENMMSDNGAEFGSGRQSKNKKSNPFEIMLEELGIRHKYIKPYHPQTNGKIERIWRSMDEELIDADWDSWEEFEVELLKYILYYNEVRIHQGIGTTPLLQKQLICSRII